MRASENMNFKFKEDEAIPKSQKLNGIGKGRLSTTHKSAVHPHLILIQAESYRNNLSVSHNTKERKKYAVPFKFHILNDGSIQSLFHCFEAVNNILGRGSVKNTTTLFSHP